MIDPQLFVLVNEENTRQIFAFGIDTGEEVVTFRRDGDNKAIFGVHTSVDTALRLNNRMIGDGPALKVTRFDCLEQWEDEEVEYWQQKLRIARKADDAAADADGTGQVRPSPEPSGKSPASS
jgi:hypothetical protein